MCGVSMTFFDKTAAALVDTIAAGGVGDPRVRPPASGHAAAGFVLGQLAHVSSPLRWPLRAATCGLSLIALLATGAPFHRLPLARRRRLVDGWRRSALGPLRDVVRLYDSLTVFALHGSEAT
jgi:hypothetical protein